MSSSTTTSSPAPVTLITVTPQNASRTIPQVLSLVKALALYEKEPESSVEATVPILYKSFFGEEDKEHGGYASCILAFRKGEGWEQHEPVGMAVYCYSFSTWTGRGGLYLEDLFVQESARGLGIGKALFKYLGQICKEKQLPRMDWVVLDWNVDAKEVYRRMGAVHKKEWEGMRLEGAALAKLAE